MDFITHTISVLNHGCARNATRVVARYSKQTVRICKMLEKEGYISGYNVCIKAGTHGVRYSYVEIFLMVFKNTTVMWRVFRVSHAGHHRYFLHRELRERIAQDRTFYVVSTIRGWMSIAEAVRRGLGGEVLFGVSS